MAVLRPVCGSWINVPRPDLAARPRRGGNGRHRRKRRLDLLLTAPGQVVVREPAGMGDQQPDRLGGVDRAAAADRHQAVAASGRDRRPGPQARRLRSGWLATSLKTTACLPSGPATIAVSPLGDQPGISHDQRSRAPQPRQLADQKLASARRQTESGSEK